MQNNNQNQTANPKNAGLFDIFKKRTAKTFAQIFPKNPYAQTQNATEISKSYSEAQDFLRQKPYVERIKGTLQAYNIVIVAYPILSVLLGLATLVSGLYLFLDIENKYLFYVVFAVFGLIGLGLLALLENIKIYALSEYFTQKEKKALHTILLTLLLSILISASGGYLSANFITDKTAKIENLASAKSDSLRVLTEKQIKDLDLIIATNTEILGKKSAKWQKNLSSQAINEAQNQKTELTKLLDSQATTINENTTKEVSSTQNKATENAIIAFICVLFLELLYVFAYAKKAQISEKTEIENQNHNVVKPQNITIASDSQLPSFEELGKILLLQNLGLIQGQTIVLPTNQTNQNQGVNGQKVAGFQFGNTQKDVHCTKRNEQSELHVNKQQTSENGQDVHCTKSNELSELHVKKNVGDVYKCLHCGKEYKARTIWQKYCSKDCNHLHHNFIPKKKGLGIFEGFVLVGILCNDITILATALFSYAIAFVLVWGSIFGFWAIRKMLLKRKINKLNNRITEIENRIQANEAKIKAYDSNERLLLPQNTDKPKNKGLGFFEGFVLVGILCSQIDFFTLLGLGAIVFFGFSVWYITQKVNEFMKQQSEKAEKLRKAANKAKKQATKPKTETAKESPIQDHQAEKQTIKVEKPKRETAKEKAAKEKEINDMHLFCVGHALAVLQTFPYSESIKKDALNELQTYIDIRFAGLPLPYFVANWQTFQDHADNYTVLNSAYRDIPFRLPSQNISKALDLIDSKLSFLAKTNFEKKELAALRKRSRHL